LGLAHSILGVYRFVGGVGVHPLVDERVTRFTKMKAEGKTSKAPLTESFGQWKNLKIVILALIGLTAGQAVVWYTGQFYVVVLLDASVESRWRHGQFVGGFA